MEDKKISWLIISLLNDFFSASNSLSLSFFFLKQKNQYPTPLHITFIYQLSQDKETIEGSYEHLLFNDKILQKSIMGCNTTHELSIFIHQKLMNITIEKNEDFLANLISGVQFDKKDWRQKSDKIFGDVTHDFFINEFHQKLNTDVININECNEQKAKI